MKKNTADFFYEAGCLKLVPRSGWLLTGIKAPESVAEHSWRATLLAFVLARLEGADAEKIAVAAAFHDLHETRIQDRHHVSQACFKTPRDAKERVESEQQALLPASARPAQLSDREKIIVRDADLLECAFQAREYEAIGYKEARDWYARVGKVLKTASARRLHAEMLHTQPANWWKGLKTKISSEIKRSE
ncbi:MAG: HD domain-containing protein [Candidatus Micrarchaeia archaeon]